MTTVSAQHTERLTRNNALLLLVDHQIGLYSGVRDIDTLQLKHNIVGLTRAMLALKVPAIVTTTTEKWWGPLHGLPIIERTTVLGLWRRSNIIHRRQRLAGRAFPLTCAALGALADGFQSRQGHEDPAARMAHRQSVGSCSMRKRFLDPRRLLGTLMMFEHHARVARQTRLQI